MKLLTVLFSLMFSISSFATCFGEAQFIGKVSKVRVSRIDQGIKDCYFSVDNFSHYNESMVCPLHMIEVRNAEILNENCGMNLSVGDDISGILVKNADGSISLE